MTYQKFTISIFFSATETEPKPHFESLPPSTSSDPMDIDVDEQLNQLDQFLQYPFSVNPQWDVSNTESTPDFSLDESTLRTQNYQNYSYYPKQRHCPGNCEKHGTYQPTSSNLYPQTWQTNSQYVPSYQHYLLPRDLEKSYACSNI